MSFELLLALRYLRGSRHVFGGMLTSGIAITGIALGVAALGTTLAVMTGFRADIRAKILGAQPHLMVMGSGGSLPARDWSPIFKGVKDVETWSPFVMKQVLIKKGGSTQGVIIKGVDPDKEPTVTLLSQRMKEGSWNALKQKPRAKEFPPMFLGKELALAVNARLGDSVLIAVPSGGLGALSEAPAFYSFTVAGLLQTGLYDYDSTLAVVSLQSAQALFQMSGEYTGLGVRIKDPEDSMDAVMEIQKNVGTSAWVRSWLTLNRSLFAALKLEKIMMFLLLALITLVAAFTIVSNLILVTAQKVREIGILRAMGAPQFSIQKVFLYKGLIMGGLGIVSGLVLGLGLSLLLKRYQFIHLPADVYYVETLPVMIVPGDLALVAGAAFLIVLAASFYPARLASRLDALQSIRQG